MRRETSGGTSPTSGPTPQKLSPSSILQVQESQQGITPPGAATAAAQPSDTHAGGETASISSISSSVFRRDGGRGGRHDPAHEKSAAALLSEELSRRDARLDAQHRLRLLPAALWGERARAADVGAEVAAVDGGETELTAAVTHSRTFLTQGARSAKGGGDGSATTLRHPGGACGLDASTGNKREKNDALRSQKLSVGPHDDGHGRVNGGGGGGSEFVLPIGASAMYAKAASLKRTAVTASVPLRWQSRAIALSSLRDSFREGATRGSPSMGRKMALRRCRAYCQRTKRERCGREQVYA